MSDNKLKQLALAIKLLTEKHDLAEALGYLGLSGEELANLLRVLIADAEYEQEVLVPEPGSTVGGRIFSPWERLILSTDAQHFLLSALHTNVLTPSELEQVLVLLFTQATDLVELEGLYNLLEEVVEDWERIAVLTGFPLGHVH